LSTPPTQQQQDAGIEQLNLGYHSEQDRLLLRVGLNNGTELSVWITQRIAKLLWKLLRGDRQLPNHQLLVSSQAPSEVVQQYEQMLATANTSQSLEFSTDYQPRKQVINPGGLLATKLHLTEQQGLQALELGTLEGVGLKLNLTPSLMLALCNMLQLAAKEAGWDVGSHAVVASIVVVDNDAKQVLH